MLNRYSKLPVATITNNQVLPNMGVLDSALERQQKSYDETASNISKFQSQVSGLQGYGEAAKQYISQIDEDVKNTVASVANQDLGSPEVKNKLNGYVQSIYGDKKLQEIQKVNELRSNYEKQLEDLDAKGKLHSNQKLLQDMAWENYSETGQISPELTQPLYEAADLVSERGKLVSMIKASGSDGIKFLEDGTAYKNSSKGISDSRISKAVKEQLLTYANSHAGRQEATDYKALVAQKLIDPKKMSFDNYLLNQVMATAKNYSYSDFSTNMDGALNSSKKDKEAKAEKDAYAGEGYAPAMNVSTKAEIDSDGRINLPWYSDLSDALFGGDSRTPEQLELEKTLKLSKEKAGFKGSLKEFTEQVINTDPNIKVKYYNSDKANKVSTQFFNPKTVGGSYINTKAWDESTGSWMSFSDYLEKNDISMEDAKGGFTITGELSPDNPLTPRGYQAVVAGKSVILDNSASKPKSAEQGIKDDFIHEAAKARYNGKGTHTFKFQEPSNKQWYEVTSTLDSNGELNEPTFSLIQK